MTGAMLKDLADYMLMAEQCYGAAASGQHSLTNVWVSRLLSYYAMPDHRAVCYSSAVHNVACAAGKKWQCQTWGMQGSASCGPA